MSTHSVVFDVDESLVHSIILTPTEYERFLKKYKPELIKTGTFQQRYYHFEIKDKTGSVDHVIGVIRPGAIPFLNWVFETFKGKVGFWSAGQKDYVEPLVKIIMSKLANPKYKPAFVLTYNDVEKTADDDIWKPLRTLYLLFPGLMTERSTWFLDDNPDYAKEDLLNWIQLPPFEVTLKTLALETDDVFPKVKAFLDTVKTAHDVRQIPKMWCKHPTKHIVVRTEERRKTSTAPLKVKGSEKEGEEKKKAATPRKKLKKVKSKSSSKAKS